ncbi:MAG: O-antigen ligase family protein [Patescibacteria group bacterium]|jgi:O-antigen ligase|nr:O-antigen ligase family protein [Patescibacteria group bacterium]
MEIFIFLFFLDYLVLSLKRLDIALFFVIAFLPSYLIRFTFFTIPFTLLELMILTSFAVWFVKEGPNLKKALKNRSKRGKYPFWKEIILILISSFIALAVAGFSNSALGIWKAYFFEPVLFFILIINVLRGQKGRDKIFKSLIVLALSVSVVAIYQKVTGSFIPNEFWANFETRRVVSWFSYPNAIGLLLAPLSALLLGYYFYLPKKTNLKGSLKKILVLLTIVFSVISIYFAKSEGALIALFISFLLFFLLSNKKKRRISFVVIFLILASLFIFKPLRSYVVDKGSLNDLSGQIRVNQWRETFQTFKGNGILLGNGLNSYKEAVEPFHQEGIFYNFDNIENFDAVVWASLDLQKKYWQPVEIYLYPHNIFLNFWTELGILGLIAFVILIFRAMYISLKLYISKNNIDKRQKYIALGVFSSLLIIVIHGMVDVPYFKNDLSVFFFVIIAILGSLIIDNKKNV